MLILASTSDKVQLVTANAVSTMVQASWVDLTTATGATTPGRQNTMVSTAVTTDVVPAPGSGVIRNVKLIIVHAEALQVLTLQHTDGTNVPHLCDVTLNTDEALIINEAVVQVLDATGAVKQSNQPSGGRFIKSTVYASGSANHTTDPKASTVRVRLVGGGGGGAGCTSVSSAASGGGGGGAGGYAEKTFAVSPSTAYAYAVGALGSGASGAGGGNGGNSTFTVGGTTVTAYGGSGGVVATAAAALTAYPGGTGGIVSTNGDVNAGGACGEMGVCLIVATPVVSGGAGGASDLGGGGPGRTSVGNGNNATGYGAGGGGAATGATTVRTGGNGTAGVVIVDEFT